MKGQGSRGPFLALWNLKMWQKDKSCDICYLWLTKCLKMRQDKIIFTCSPLDWKVHDVKVRYIHVHQDDWQHSKKVL